MSSTHGLTDEALILPGFGGASSQSGLPQDFASVNAALKMMNISFIKHSNRLIFLSAGSEKNSWAVVNSAKTRVKALESKLAVDEIFKTSLLEELRRLLLDANIVSEHDSCNLLTSPILTSNADLLTESEKVHDVLSLFGSPPSACQLFISVTSLRSQLLDTLLECVAMGSAHSEQILLQFLQPVGVSSFYSAIGDIQSILDRLVELYKLPHSSELKAHILSIIPHILYASRNQVDSECASTILPTAEYFLLDALDSLSFQTEPAGDMSGQKNLHSLLNCIGKLPLEDAAVSRYLGVCQSVLIRCIGLPSQCTYLNILLKSTFMCSLTEKYKEESLKSFITLLRNRFTFLDKDAGIQESFSIEQPSDVSETSAKRLIEDLIILAILFTSFSSASGGKQLFQESATVAEFPSSKRKEVSSLIKFVGILVTSQGITRVTTELLLKYEAVLTNSSVFPSLLRFTACILSAHYHSKPAIKFLGRFCSAIFGSPQTGAEQLRELVSQLCKSAMSCRVASFGFRTKGVLQTEFFALNLLISLSIQNPARMAPLTDHLFSLVENLSDGLSPTPTAAGPPDGFTNLLPPPKDIRKIYAMLVFVVFSSAERYLQDDFLLLLRKQLLSRSIALKYVGILGSVTFLEMLCCHRGSGSGDSRTSLGVTSDSSSPARHSSTHFEFDCSQSSLLASQIVHLGSQLTASPARTSRGSDDSRSNLSLRGSAFSDPPLFPPPAAIVRDQQPAMSTPATDAPDSSSITHTSARDSTGSKRPAPPPPPTHRLLLQVIGLIENAVKQTGLSQFQNCWLDELSFMFARLEQSIHTCAPNSSARQLMDWLGARFMNEFQDQFVMDNITLDDSSPLLGLNERSICEIALNVGPAWKKHSAAADHQRQNRLPPRTPAAHKGRTGSPSPLLLTGYLHLLSAVESVQNSGCLDGMDALIGCPLLLPTTALLQISPDLLITVINYCTEAVNCFASQLVLPPRKRPKSSAPPLLAHRLSATFISRVMQIAALRFCLHVLLRQRMMDAAAAFVVTVASGEDSPLAPPTLFLPTATFEPLTTFRLQSADHQRQVGGPIYQPSVKRLPLVPPQPPKKKSARVGVKPISSQKHKKKRHDPDAIQTQKRANAVDRVQNRRSRKRAKNEEEEEDDEEETCAPERTTFAEHSTIGRNMDLESEEEDAVAAVDQFARDRHSRHPDVYSDYLLSTLTPCFREMHLAVIVVTLQSPLDEPEQLKVPPASQLLEADISAAVQLVHPLPTVSVGELSDPNQPDRVLDWLTLAILLQDLKTKLDYLGGVDLKTFAGSYSFECLESISPELRRSYLLALVPSLVKAIKNLCTFYKDRNHKESDATETQNSSLSSLSGDEDETGTQPQSTGGFRPAAVVDRIRGDCLCSALYCLAALVTDVLPSLAYIKTADKLFSKPLPSQEALGRMRCLLRCLDSQQQQPHKFPPVNLDRTTSCILGDQEDDDAGGGGGGDALMNEAAKNGGTDGALTPSVGELLVLLKWLMSMNPADFFHTSAAFIHCRFVFCLAHFMKISVGDSPVPENFPDLMSYTHNLLNAKWNSSSTWQDHSHKACFEGLLSMHLMSPSFTFGPSPLEDSLLLYNRIIRSGFLALRSKLQGIDLDVTVDKSLSYNSLTSDNFGIYARAVIDAILRCIKDLSKRSPSALKPCDAPVAQLTSWNTCVDCIVSFFDLARSPHKSSDPPSKPDRHFVAILPRLMRIGRILVESVLRCVMGLLGSVFRQNTTEVLNFIRNLQQLTRLLQRVCVHAKKNQDARLIQQIPGTRKCLESFVCAVKLLFMRNSCSSALWIGTLKNRDLVGQVIQDSNQSASKAGPRGSELVEPSVAEKEAEEGDDEEEEEDDEEEEDTDDGTANVAPSTGTAAFIDDEAGVDVDVENASDSECDILREEGEDDDEDEEEEEESD